MPDPPTAKRRRPSSRAPPERFPWLRYDRAARAVTEHLRVRPVPGQPFWVLAVRNPVHHTQYHVFLPEYPTGEVQFCSCADFARRGIGTCKHIEAATTWLASHPETAAPKMARPGASSLWKAIDAARQVSKFRHGPEAIRLRAPGQILFQRTGPVRAPKSEKREAGTGSGGPVVGPDA